MHSPESSALLPGPPAQDSADARRMVDRSGSLSTLPRRSQDSGTTASLQRHLEQAMEDAGLASRGVKRTASSSSPATATSRRTSGAEPSRDQHEPDTQATALLSFCRECGEQRRTVLSDGLSHCVRCSSTETVDTPSAVKSWFDEVMEQEAVDRRFVEKTFGPSVPPSSSDHLHDHFGMSSFPSSTTTR